MRTLINEESWQIYKVCWVKPNFKEKSIGFLDILGFSKNWLINFCFFNRFCWKNTAVDRF